jgi:hypothetical protein
MLTTLLLLALVSAQIPATPQARIPAIELRNVTMAEMFSMLGEAFGVRMICKGCDLNAQIPTVSFANVTKSEALNLVAETFQLTWSENGGEVTWSQREAPSVAVAVIDGRATCHTFDPAKLGVVETKDGWQVRRGEDGRILGTLPTKADADAAMAVARKYTAMCVIGEGSRIFKYFERSPES